MNAQDSDTIIACATNSQSKAAIGILRISGFNSFESLDSFFKAKVSTNEIKKISRNIIVDTDGEVVDDVMTTSFKAPHSYTGENLLEIYCHGNPLVIEQILSLFHKNEIRMAKAGEFSLRAMKNKKLSLTQVEGLDLLLNGESFLQISQGRKSLFGELEQEYIELRKSFLNLLSSIEIQIDFLEDIGEEQADKVFNERFEKFKGIVFSLDARCQTRLGAISAPSIGIFGPPNVGKSSLFNLVLSEQRSIVSSTPGTTRDYVSELLSLDGNQFKLLDTAGIRSSSNEIEEEGIKRSRDLKGKSFFNLSVSSSLDDLLGTSDSDIILITHCDIAQVPSEEKKLPKNLVLTSLDGPIGPDWLKWSDRTKVNCVPKDDLFTFLKERILLKFREVSNFDPILVPRQREVIHKISELLKHFDQLLRSERDIAVISSEMHLVGQHIEELIGVNPPDDVLNNIFENFCIGK